MHSVLFLILAFFSPAGLFVLLGAEFLAMLLVVVYVGAVAVLFLFVVMMLDVDFAELRAGLRQVPADRRLIAGGIVLVELILLFVGRGFGAASAQHPGAAVAELGREVTNTAALGRVLYTRYVYFFQAAGLVLLVAMIGAIVLTLRHKPGVQRQVDRRPGGAHAGDRHRDRQGAVRRLDDPGRGREADVEAGAA